MATTSFVIYNKETWKLYSPPGSYRTAHYYDERVAKGQFTKLCKKFPKFADKHVVEAYVSYVKKIPMVETRNIMNPGKPVMIRADQLGTCTDPGTETYHCM